MKTIKESNQERRHYTRYLLSLSYRLETEDDIFFGMTRDLSLGGAFLATLESTIRNEKPHGEGFVTLTTTFAELSAKCNIIYPYEDGLGIEFIETTDEFCIGIKKLIKKAKNKKKN